MREVEMKTKLIILVAVLIIFCACARIRGYVNSIKDPQIDPISEPYKNYIMVPSMKGIDPATDLQYKEYEQILEQSLRIRGFTKSPSLEKAGVIIFVAYGIGDPQQQIYTAILPVYGQTGVSSSTTTGTINLYKNYGTYNSTTTYNPSYGITGYVPITNSTTMYTRYLIIDAIDMTKYRASQKIVPVWKTTVFSTGSTGDLRTVFPYLAKAASRYLGQNTGKAIRVEMQFK
jgi:hypothetical protein